LSTSQNHDFGKNVVVVVVAVVAIVVVVAVIIDVVELESDPFVDVVVVVMTTRS
jgi:hypothetical protein